MLARQPWPLLPLEGATLNSETGQLLASLETTSAPKDREVEAARARHHAIDIVNTLHLHMAITAGGPHHTAMSTAYPQPAPGTANAPGPLKVPTERLRSVLGVTTLDYRTGAGPLALTDRPLTTS